MATCEEDQRSGEQTNALTSSHSLWAGYDNASTGQFNRLDDFFGNHHDPQSLHKYAYVHGDPVMGVDPSGNVIAMTLNIGTMMGIVGYAHVGLAVYDAYQGSVRQVAHF